MTVTNQPPEYPYYPGHAYRYPAGWYPPAPPTSAAAVISLIAGLLWFFWIGSIAAVILGHVALQECREQGKAGSGLAVAGLVFGYLGMGTLAFWLFIFMVGGLAAA